MDPLLTQIISGVAVAIVSFGFGYFLFRFQRAEETKLEVFRRRLNSYETIAAYLEELDTFSHRGPAESNIEKNKLVEKGFRIQGPARIYVAPEVNEGLGNLILLIDSLPDNLGDFEEEYEELFALIEKEVGSYLINSRTIWDTKKASNNSSMVAVEF